MSSINLWMRLGVTLNVTPEQAKRILTGDETVLKDVLDPQGQHDFFDRQKPWYFDGEAYTPDDIAYELCGQLGLNFNECKDFNL